MVNRIPRQFLSIAGFTLVIVSMLVAATPSYLSATVPQQPVYINWTDTGKTIPLQSGQQLIVKLPMHDYADNSWHISKISPNLKLVAGPDELRPLHWSPWTLSFQVFYFRRVAPGTADLVMEPNYFLKPLVLRVAD